MGGDMLFGGGLARRLALALAAGGLVAALALAGLA